MTAIERVLLRKDIASLIVAIVAAMATANFLTLITMPVAFELTGVNNYSIAGENVFLTKYVQPVIAFALQVIALELLLRLVIFVRQQLYKQGIK